MRSFSVLQRLRLFSISSTPRGYPPHFGDMQNARADTSLIFVFWRSESGENDTNLLEIVFLPLIEWLDRPPRLARGKDRAHADRRTGPVVLVPPSATHGSP